MNYKQEKGPGHSIKERAGEWEMSYLVELLYVYKTQSEW